MNCIFCNIVTNKVLCHKIWEDTNHLAFLSIYPNTDGFSVVIPKVHYPSYIFKLPNKILNNLIIATKKVSQLLDRNFEDVARCGMICEGFGVDHAHVKLIPMHGTTFLKPGQPIKSTIKTFFEHYEGYLSSHDADRADDIKLARLAKKIRQINL